jgi:hypothetical protein
MRATADYRRPFGAAKNKEMHKSHAEFGLHPATLRKVAKKCLALLNDTFRVKEGKKEYCAQASLEDLKRHLETIGEKKEYIRRTVTMSVNHLKRKTYKSLVKGILQIPLKNFQSGPKFNIQYAMLRLKLSLIIQR